MFVEHVNELRLGGFLSFQDDRIVVLHRKIKKGQYHMLSPYFANISTDGMFTIYLFHYQ